MMRKILYSPGYGAGWSSWNSGEVAKYMVDYKPIVDFLEAGNNFTGEDCGGFGTEDNGIHPLLKQLQDECKEKFNANYVCILGAKKLRVREVFGRVRITEYDGFEDVEEEGDFSEWL